MTRKDVESLFKTHYTQMYHLALTLLFDEAESKDVVSDVFASLISTPKPQQPTTEQTTDINPVAPLPADTVQTDTIPVEPYIFNNVPLDSMLTASARELRFHFVWKREDSLSRVVEKLNTFEAVNIVEEDKTLVVR